MKKPITWIIILAILLLVPLMYYLFSREEVSPADPVEAIPQDAVLILRGKDLVKEIKQRLDNDIWNELCNFPVIDNINRQLAYFDSLSNTNLFVRNFLREKQIVFSVHPTGKNRYELIWYLTVQDRNSEKQIIEFIQTNIKEYGQLTERKYESRIIYETDLNNNQYKNFSFTISKGLLICSHSAILIEEAIRQLDLDNNLGNQAAFNSIATTAGKNVNANFFINNKTLPGLLRGLVNDSYENRLIMAENLAIWSALDITVKNDALLLNGFSSIDPDENLFLNLFLDQTPQRLEIQKVIPVDFAAYIVLEMDNYQKFKEQYDNYLDINGILKIRKQEIEKVNDDNGIDIERIFMDIIEQELALIITDIQDLSPEENVFFALRCKNQTFALETIKDMVVQISDKKQIPFTQMVFEQNITSDFSQEFFIIPVPDPKKYISGGLFNEVNNNYCTFIDNYLIFGSSPIALSKYVYLNILQSTLDSDLDFNRLTDYLAAKSNIHIFVNIPRSLGLIDEYLSTQAGTNLKKSKESLLKFKAFSYQLSVGNDLVYNNSFLKYSTEIKEQPHTVWASRLDNPAAGKPILVANHYTNEKEIFLQDQKNKIYLINNSGRILWKMNLQAKINSDIYQIDYYKNGKLQLMFSTETQIHLIDRNGNYIENYPVNLRAPACTGLAVFDYEKTKDYRIFIPATDQKIYCYDIKGMLLPGWEFNKTDDPVYQPLQHFRISDKDYLVCLDKFNIYILDRKGQSRVSVKKHFPVSPCNTCILDRGSLNTNPRLVLTDTSGHVHFVYLTGDAEEMVLGDFSSGHYFNYQDLNGDGSKEFIFTDNNELIVFNENGSRLFSRVFD